LPEETITTTAFWNPYAGANVGVVFDPTFDPSSEAAQVALRDACRALVEPLVNETWSPFDLDPRLAHLEHCVMGEFSDWVVQNIDRNGFPLPRHLFGRTFWRFLSETNFQHITAGHVGFTAVPNTTSDTWPAPAFVTAGVIATFNDRGVSAPALLEHYNEWEALCDALVEIAKSPQAGTPWTYSLKWVGMRTQIVAMQGTVLSIWSAIVSAVLVVAIFCACIHIASLTLFNLAFITLMMLGMFASLGWEIGAAEALSLTVLVGLSVDFCLHVAMCFITSPAVTREARVKEAILELGGTITAGAGSTIIASLPMASCTLLILSRIGQILICNMLCGASFALGFFCPLLVIAGPRHLPKTWLANIKVAFAGSVLHVITTGLFVSFMAGSVIFFSRMSAFPTPSVAANLGVILAILIGPVVAGLLWKPLGSKEDNNVQTSSSFGSTRTDKLFGAVRKLRRGMRQSLYNPGSEMITLEDGGDTPETREHSRSLVMDIGHTPLPEILGSFTSSVSAPHVTTRPSFVQAMTNSDQVPALDENMIFTSNPLDSEASEITMTPLARQS